MESGALYEASSPGDEVWERYSSKAFQQLAQVGAVRLGGQAGWAGGERRNGDWPQKV